MHRRRNLSTRRRRYAFPGVLTGLCLAAFAVCNSTPAAAQEVVIFKKPPASADAMADILFPRETPRTTRAPEDVILRFRGIELVEKTAKDRVSGFQPPARPKVFGFLLNFEFNSTTLVGESRPFLELVGEMLNLDRVAGRRILIEGHTDAIGPDEYNQRLSARRAEAVKNYLVRHHGIDPDRLATVGKGEHELLDTELPENPINRRVQFRSAS